MSDLLKTKLAAELERHLFETMARTTTTVADPAPADKTPTIEKLLTGWKALLDDLPSPDPLAAVNQIWCNERMVPEGRRVRDELNRSRRLTPLSAGVLLVVKELMPDGCLFGMKPGRFGPEVAFLISPEKNDLDMSK